MSTIRTVGEVSYDSSQLIGKGTNTFVFKGTFERRKVAIKKIFCESDEDVEKRLNEVKILWECDSHDDIVKYHRKERDSDFIYIALELCDGNLQQWMESKIPNINHDAISAIEILHQTTNGLAHLHSMGIIHRDLKPHDILLTRLNQREIRVKIADFGISRVLPEGRTSVTIRTGSGTVGWRSPEILNYSSNASNHVDKMSTTTDIFSLGCLYYYVLTAGKHPFGDDPIVWEHNIKNYSNLSINQQHFSALVVGNCWLIQEMIARDPKARPSAEKMLSHHMFWKSDKTLDFIVQVSDILADRRTDPTVKNCAKNIESYYDYIAPYCHPGRFGNPDGWLSSTCPVVKFYLQNNESRTYRGGTLYQLIRAVRSLKGHYGTLSENWSQVQVALGSIPDGYVRYWISRFPFLVPTLWIICQMLKTSDNKYNLNRFYERE